VSPQVTSRLGGRARFMSTRSRFLTKSRIRPSFFVHDGNLYRGFTMSKRLLIIFCALFAVPSAAAVFAQNQSTGAPDFQTASSGVDNQGVRHYRLGPGDLIDVRVFGQPDLNSQAEIDEDGNISSLPFVE